MAARAANAQVGRSPLRFVNASSTAGERYAAHASQYEQRAARASPAAAEWL